MSSETSSVWNIYLNMDRSKYEHYDFFRDVAPSLPIPVLDRIIARRSAPESQVGAIIVPDTAQSSTDNKPQTATVLAVGPGLKTAQGGRKLMAVMPGDTIVFSRYTGGDVPGHPGCIIMRETDVLGIVE